MGTYKILEDGAIMLSSETIRDGLKSGADALCNRIKELEEELSSRESMESRSIERYKFLSRQIEKLEAYIENMEKK